MTLKEKVLGLVALVATLLLGLVIGVNLKSEKIVEKTFGSAQTSPSHLTDTGSLTNMGSLYLWDTQTGGGFEVQGPAYFDSAVNVYGAFTPSGVVNGVVAVSSASTSLASTTLCSIACTADWVVTGGSVDLGINTSTVTTTIVFGVTSTPIGVPASPNLILGSVALATSSARQVITTSSVTGILCASGQYVNATLGATTTHSGVCRINTRNF